jgi:aspartate/methionine/tyrosine aminotransferase
VKAHQFTTFTTPPDLQKAVAYGLAKENAYFEGLAAELEAKRDRLAADCAALGFGVIRCEGTYFLTLDFGPLDLDGDDAALARRMTIEAGVTSVPVSAFYASAAPRNYIRLCFAKRDAVLDEAVDRMRNWLKSACRTAA